MVRFLLRPSLPHFLSMIALLLMSCLMPALAEEHLDPAVIGNASGATTSMTDDGVVRIGWSRTDVEVTVDGMTLPPAWARGRHSRAGTTAPW